MRRYEDFTGIRFRRVWGSFKRTCYLRRSQCTCKVWRCNVLQHKVIPTIRSMTVVETKRRRDKCRNILAKTRRLEIHVSRTPHTESASYHFFEISPRHVPALRHVQRGQSTDCWPMATVSAVFTGSRPRAQADSSEMRSSVQEALQTSTVLGTSLNPISCIFSRSRLVPSNHFKERSPAAKCYADQVPICSATIPLRSKPHRDDGHCNKGQAHCFPKTPFWEGYVSDSKFP